MSGSYDRPRFRPRVADYSDVPTHDGYVEPLTGHPTGPPPPIHHTASPTAASVSHRAEMYPPQRSQQAVADPIKAPIVPAGSVTGRSLTSVISIMCFFACLTAGAVYMMNQSASAWLKDIASEVTVQIDAREKAEGEKVVKNVAGFLGPQRA